MLPISWLRSLRARSHSSRKTSSHRRSKAGSAIHSLERLEDRLALSGFGPGDGAYIVEARSGGYSSVAIQPTDQKIVAAGGGEIARYDSAGNSDASYGNGGLATVPSGGASGLVLQPDGKAVVSTATAQTVGAVRFTTIGLLDTGFGSGGLSSVTVPTGYSDDTRGMGLQSTGNIVVGGFALSPASVIWADDYSAVLASFTPSGATDSGKGGFGQVVQGKAIGYSKETFGGQEALFEALTIDANNRVVSVGGFDTTVPGGTLQLLIARHTATGILDKTFNGSGYSMLNLPGVFSTNGTAVALDSSGKIVVGGFYSAGGTSDNMLVVRYNTNGTLDNTFGGGKGYVLVDVGGATPVRLEGASGVAIQPDGKIVLAGTEGSSTTTGPDSAMVARLNPDGTLDAGFGTGGIKLASPPAGMALNEFHAGAVALESDGSIIVAGYDGGILDPNTFATYPMLMRFSGASNATSSATSISAAGTLANATTTGASTATVTESLTPPTPVVSPMGGNTSSSPVDQAFAAWSDELIGSKLLR